MRFPRILILACVAALIVVPAAFALRFTDDSFDMPTGYTGHPYTKQMNGAGGCKPLKFSLITDTLPPGLTLTSTGLISGVPTDAGSWSFWVQLKSSCPADPHADREFTIKVLEGLTIQQTQSTLTPGQLTVPYSVQLTVNSGTPTWSVTSGTLPPGIGLDTSTGQLSGTPTAAGSYTFRIQAVDGERSDTQTYTITVVPQLTMTAPSPVAGEVGRRVTIKSSATGGKPAYTWSLDPSTPLPAGLALDPASGTITGLPTAPGAHSLKLVVTDTLGLQKSSTIRLAVASRLAVAKTPVRGATVGRRYVARFRSTGGVAPRIWRILGGRPGFLTLGLSLNARTGVISGTPRTAGTYRLLVQVTDRLGARAAVRFVLRVSS
ncbi:MAG TPA: Ig domain-containing protein [Gaiellaceae bacterium]|nr:Ig domain-containing protein [Gaiellaceae bacterium]